MADSTTTPTSGGYTVSQVAGLLNRPETTVRGWANRGLPATFGWHKTGRVWTATNRRAVDGAAAAAQHALFEAARGAIELLLAHFPASKPLNEAAALIETAATETNPTGEL